MRYKYIIFDRDGTLNKSAESAGGYILHPDQMTLLPGAKNALNALFKEGVRAFVFTNQPAIGEGLLSKNILIRIHNKLKSLIGKENPIEAFYHCPHIEGDHCDCRKPKPGLLKDCIEDNNLDKNDVLVVGDGMEDYQSAKALGLNFAFIKSGKHTEADYKKAKNTPFFDDLPALVNHFYGLEVCELGKEHSVYGVSLFIILAEIIGLFIYALTYQYY